MSPIKKKVLTLIFFKEAGLAYQVPETGGGYKNTTFNL